MMRATMSCAAGMQRRVGADERHAERHRALQERIRLAVHEEFAQFEHARFVQASGGGGVAALFHRAIEED